MLYYIGSSFDSSQSSTMNPFNVFTQLTPPASIEIPNTQTSQSDPSKLFKWDDNDVRLLIESYSQHKQLLKKGKLTKKQLFERVAHHFNTKSKVIVSGEQCLRKWNKLVQKYKEVEDNNKQTGRANKDWKYMECMGDSPNVNPAYTFDTSSSSPSPSACSLETTNDDNEDVTSDDEQNKDVKKPVTRKRKRKSNSSASEMLSFLKDYSEKREKAEEKKVELLREMHEEKNQFFSQFLEVMKKK